MRETHRAELAALVHREATVLADDARLLSELALDSLAMMSVVAWLESHGVTIDAGRTPPSTVGELLSLLDKPPNLRISVTDGAGESLGPAHIPSPASSAGGGIDPLLPVLEDHTVRLTPVNPDDVGFLYDLTVRPENCFRWRYRGAPPSFERFVEDLWKAVMVQFVVRRAADGKRIGHVVVYAAHTTLHYAYVGAVFLPEFAGTGIPAHSVSLFVRYLFHTFPLRKVYLEVPGFNWDRLRSGEGTLFRVEGRLIEHNHYAGRFWDEYLCAIYREP